MEIKFKKSFIGIIIELLSSLIIIFLLIVNIYALINYSSEIYLYYLVSFLSLILLILLLRIIKFLLYGYYPISIYKGYIVINRCFKKKIIKFNEIYAIYSSLSTQSIFYSGYIIIYLNSGKKIKIDYLKQAKDIKEIIEANLIKNKGYLIFKENKIKKAFIRIFNFFIYLMTRIISIKESKIVNSLDDLALTYKTHNKKKVFIVISNSIYKNKSFIDLFNKFDELEIKYSFFPLSIHNPDVNTINELKDKYLSEDFDSLLAIGGGSIIDLTKGLGISVTSLNKDLSKFKGYFKLHKKIPYFCAIDTVNASGSEVTGAAVINFNNSKCAIYSPKLVPSYTYLGKENIVTLPSFILKRSSLDTLTHSLESYFNLYSYKRYDNLALESIKLVFSNYFKIDKEDNEALRIDLLKASYLGGVSFNHKFVGNVHALSHPLSFKYNLDHSSTNGIILPFILSRYRFNKRFMKKVAKMMKYLGLIDKIDKTKYEEYLNLLLDKINLMIKEASLLPYINEIKGEDLEELTNMAYKEAIPMYPTPIVFSKSEFMMMYINLKFINNNDKESKNSSK